MLMDQLIIVFSSKNVARLALEFCYFFGQVYAREYRAPAAVSLDPQIVEHALRLLPLFDALLELLVLVA